MLMVMIASLLFCPRVVRAQFAPPTLSCPSGQSVLDWDDASNAWNSGETSNNYSVAGVGTVSFNVAAPSGTGTLENRDEVSGGYAPVPNALHYDYDFANNAQESVTTIDLSSASDGVQFEIFDIDGQALNFADRVSVTASLGGSTVPVDVNILTPGAYNFFDGSAVNGINPASDVSAQGTVTYTISQPFDRIIITYGVYSDFTPFGPGPQNVALHDMTFCATPPLSTDIEVLKSSSVLNDLISSANPKAIPGATIRYCISISNNGAAAATSVAVQDPIPDNVSYIPGSLRSGSNCSGSMLSEDDDATGSDESDPYGASFDAGASANGTVISNASSLNPGEDFAVTFDATMD